MHSGRAAPTVAQSIRDATAQAMREDDSVILFGLGVNDPGRVFGTTSGLVEEFGIERVFETPTAENAMMGVAVGAALGGFRPIITHQRADFFYLAMDQLVNSAAKWRFMFGGQFSVPLVIRLIVGRGWGQGPTHSQNLATWLAHIPGLKIVYPSNSSNAASLLREAICDDNPVVFIEDRWLHSRSFGPSKVPDLALGSSVVRRKGADFTLVAYGSMVNEALGACDLLSNFGLEADLVDLGTLIPRNLVDVLDSVRRSHRLLVIEPGPVRGSFGEALIGAVLSETINRSSLEFASVLGAPFTPQPTSFGATKDFYPTATTIAESVLRAVGEDPSRMSTAIGSELPHDKVDSSSSGPF